MIRIKEIMNQINGVNEEPEIIFPQLSGKKLSKST